MNSTKDQLTKEYRDLLKKIDTYDVAMYNFLKKGKIEVAEHYLKLKGECIDRLVELGDMAQQGEQNHANI